MLFSKKKNFYKLYCIFVICWDQQSDCKKNKTSYKDNVSINGIYTEYPREVLNNAILAGNKVWIQGIIDKLEWDCCPYITLEDLQKKFMKFAVGKYLNINELKYILLFLKQQLNMDYQFHLTIQKNKPERIKVTLKEKEGERFIVTKVIVKGNSLLAKSDILEAINPALCSISLVEKIKWLIFKKTGALVTGINIEQGVERLIKNIGDNLLLLDLKAQVVFTKNHKTKTATATVTVTEGSKYFIGKIYLDKRIKVPQKQLRMWIEKKGFTGGNFNNLKEFFQAYNYYNLNIYHKIDGNYIDIYIGVHNAEFSQIVKAITYLGFSDVSMNYIYKHLKVRINEPYNRNFMEEFIYKQSIILNATLTQEEIGNLFKEITIQVTKTAKETEQDFFTVKNSHAVIRYKFIKRLNEHPNLIITVIPEVHFGSTVQFGCILNITYNLQNLWKLQILDGEILLNFQGITEKENIIKSINARFMQLTNHFNSVHNLRWNISPLNIVRTFNNIGKESINDSLKNHIYVYIKGRVQKLFIYPVGIRRVKISHFASVKYFFGHNIKLKYNPEFSYPITKYLHLLGSVRILFNSQTSDRKQEEIFLNWSAINNGDMMRCLFWKNYITDNVENKDAEELRIDHYLSVHDVILSNLLLNFRLMLNYIIFKTTFPVIGKIQLSIFLFMNCLYDYTNNIQRFSYGTGIMGVYNTNAILLSIGQKYSPKNDTPGLHYDLTFENYVF